MDRKVGGAWIPGQGGRDPCCGRDQRNADGVNTSNYFLEFQWPDGILIRKPIINRNGQSFKCEIEIRAARTAILLVRH